MGVRHPGEASAEPTNIFFFRDEAFNALALRKTK